MHAVLVTMADMMGSGTLVLSLIIVWMLPWKLYSVWLAVKRGDSKWFIALVILNTLAILDIYYIFKVAGKSWKDIGAIFKHSK